jgi:hypothetical protein
MTEINISSIPLMQMLLESIEITVLTLKIQRVMESDSNLKPVLDKRIFEYEDLAGKFKTILENSQKHD